MDNVRSRKSLVQYPNLDLVMLEPDNGLYTTIRYNGVYHTEQQYRWLGKYLLKEGSITEEKAILKISELFGSLGQNAIDNGLDENEKRNIWRNNLQNLG